MFPTNQNGVVNLAAVRSQRGGAPRLKAVTLAVAALAAMTSAHASAQVKQPAAAATEALVPVEVVTVTATRRREPLRDVPLRVETLSAERLAEAGAASLVDYVGSLPGVHVASDGGPGRGQVQIRGVSVGGHSAPTVGTYIDEVAFGSTTNFVGEAASALDMSLLDLHHIELLRGPQGTLYGAGAMGGLLKYVTNEPDSTAFSGKAGLALRSTRNGKVGHTENVVLNVPLSEGVAAVRVAMFNESDGGYITASGRAAAEHANDGNTRGGRISVLLDPMSRMRVRLTATEQKIKRNGTGFVQYNVASGEPLNGDLVHKIATPEPYTIKTSVVSADLEYDFGWARFNLIGSSQRFNSATVLDATDIVGSPAFNFAELDNTTSLRKQTQEIRLTSARGTLEWLAGLYHNKEVGQRDQRLWGQLAGNGSEMTFVQVGQPSRYEENAFYGDLTYNPSAALSFTIGARAARNKELYGTVTNGVRDFEAPANDASKTYLATVRYSLDKVSSVYFRAASGYRPGGPNPPAIDDRGQLIPGAPKSFGPDTLWSYEIGYKADLLNKRLFVEAALFNIDWNKLQTSLAIGATSLTTNAGKANVKGLELATRFKLDQHWSLDGGLSYTDGKLSEDAPGLGPSGSRLPNTAKVSASAGARYAGELLGKPTHAGLSVRRVGQRNAGFDAVGTSVPNFSMAGYTVADAHWNIDLGNWQLGTYVRNLSDKRALISADAALTAFGGPLNAVPITPRTIGANLAVSF